eukprot:jgi/Mesen1/8783/ME000526S08093
MAAVSWRYRGGLILIAIVVLIWVASAEVTQLIFSTYRHPFLLTWLGASLLSVYLPISYIKDFLKPFVKRSAAAWSKSLDKTCGRREKDNADAVSSVSPRILPSLSPRAAAKSGEVELSHLNGNALEVLEEGKSLIPKDGEKEKAPVVMLTTAEVFRVALILAPLWLLTEYLSNAALSLTSVASTTILSSTSGLFTLLVGASMGQDSLTTAKVIAVLISLAGVIMTELGKSTALDELDLTAGERLAGNGTGEARLPGHSLIGDCFGLASAAAYGLYTVMLKKYVGEEEDSGIDMQRVFGYIGLVTLLGLWWIAVPLIFLGWEPSFAMPSSKGLDEDILANALVGSVISDYFWALSVVWTTPLVATLGLSLTIPLAMLADMVMHGRSYSAVYVLGSIQVFGGFLIANLSDKCSFGRFNRNSVE